MSAPQSPGESSGLNLAHYCITEGVNGPGRRFPVWVQGCPQRCPGCFNPGLQADLPRRQTTPEDLARAVADFTPVDGITLSGGEPFAQAPLLSRFLDAVAEQRGPNPLSVIAFSGYTLAELEGGPPGWRQLLSRVDLLVDGSYREGVAPVAPLTGSGNQRCVVLTPVGGALMAEVESAAAPVVEVQIAADGEVVISGFPPPELLRALRGPARTVV
jgi:anaerobic ribonucleoside-triphosphate reductase activating protein